MKHFPIVYIMILSNILFRQRFVTNQSFCLSISLRANAKWKIGLMSTSNLSDTCQICLTHVSLKRELPQKSEPKQTIYVTSKMMTRRQILTVTLSLNVLQQVVTNFISKYISFSHQLGGVVYFLVSDASTAHKTTGPPFVRNPLCQKHHFSSL